MPICAHGKVCLAWMKRFPYTPPLSKVCPYNCDFFENLEPREIIIKGSKAVIETVRGERNEDQRQRRP